MSKEMNEVMVNDMSFSFDLSSLLLSGRLAFESPYSSVVTGITFTFFFVSAKISFAKSHQLMYPPSFVAW